MTTLKQETTDPGTARASRPPPSPTYVVLGASQGPGQPPGLSTGIARHGTLIALTTLLFAVAAALASFALPRTYRAEVLFKPVEAEQPRLPIEGLADRFGGLASLAGLTPPSKGNRQEALAVLKSRRFSLHFLHQNKRLPMLFPERWNAGEEAWTEEPERGAPSDGEIFERFDHDVRHVHENGRTGLVTLAIDLKDRETAARWANRLVERANQYLKEQAIDEATRSLAYLNKALAKTDVVEIQNAIYRLIEIQTQKIMLANVRKEFAFKVIDPAMPPDERDYIWPNPWILAFSGGMGGLLLSLIIATLLTLRNRHRNRPEQAA